MKSPHNKAESAVDDVHSLLDADLPAGVRDDITQARHQAIREARQQLANKSGERAWLPAVLIPSALVLAMAVLILPDKQSVPLLPGELSEESLSSEDLAIVEDLEFAHWLAEQEVRS